jgi:hypothetical protein
MRDDRRLIEINDPEEIPTFASEAEEAAFWDTHRFGPGMIAHAQQHPDLLLDEIVPARAASITIRLDGDVLRRLRRLAQHKGRRYQTLLKEFVTERLYEEEKRDGFVG